jgi:hypothetical protein
MIILENIYTGEVFTGNDLEYFVDDATMIGEVYLDGDLIFQSIEVANEEQLELEFVNTFQRDHESDEFLII